jgi:mercuric ion transport protein
MKYFLEQIASMTGAGISAACCLGIPLVLSAVSAVGLGFLIQDAYLLPIFAGFVGLTQWIQYRTARQYQHFGPFWLSLAGGGIAIVSLGLLLTGVYGAPWLVYLGTSALVGASIWGFIDSLAARRKGQICAVSVPVDDKRRALNGTVLATAAAGAFFAIYKTVDTIVPSAQAGDIACYGTNSCKGQSGCTTAFNACNGQNECKGKGISFLPQKQCYAQGGVQLKGSAADPAKS